MEVTAFSNRYYADELQDGMFDLIADAIREFNDIKFQMYDAWYKHRYAEFFDHDILEGTTLYKYARSFGLSSMYANAMEPMVKGILQSQVANKNLYIDKTRDDMTSIRGKLNDASDVLDKKKAVKESIVAYAKTGKWNKPYPKCTISIDSAGILKGYNIQPCTYQEYEYKLDREIKHLKARCNHYLQAIKRRESKIDQMASNPPKRAIFGSRRLYRQKDTIGNTKQWHDLWDESRYKSITISGRADSVNGNFIAKFNFHTKELSWTLPNGRTVILPDFKLHTYMNEYMNALADKNKSHTSIAYAFEIRHDGNGRRYLLVKASFHVKENERMNDAYITGCIAVDLNYDKIAWSELFHNGRQLRHGMISLNLEGLTSNQASDAIGRAVRKITKLCEDAGKPLVMEDLDSSSMKTEMRYKNKTKNRKVSAFACEKIRQTICSQAVRAGFTVSFVNPKYTSVIGKILYMRTGGQSIHESASYVIGLRGLGIYPEPPESMRSLIPEHYPKWAESEEQKFFFRWRSIRSAVNKIPTHLFYRKLPVFQDSKELSKWLKTATA